MFVPDHDPLVEIPVFWMLLAPLVINPKDWGAQEHALNGCWHLEHEMEFESVYDVIFLLLQQRCRLRLRRIAVFPTGRYWSFGGM